MIISEHANMYDVVASVALLRSWVRLPVGANFRLRLKNPLACLHAKEHGNRSRLTPARSHTGYGMGYGAPV